MNSPRKILHIDLDAFFCAVEEQHDPSLIGVPFAVGGRPDERGVVSSCSYAARQQGVHSAMPMIRAKRLCPELRIIAPRHNVYSQCSKEVMKRLHAVTPLVEQVSIDEAFLDISGYPDPAEVVAYHLQTKIRNELGLPCSIGVASNKLIAKTANDVGKAKTIDAEKVLIQSGSHPKDKIVSPPNAITVVPPGHEASFLADLPVRALWGVGPKTATRLASLDILTIGQLANRSESELVHLFGKNGFDLALRAKGIDDRPIITHHEPKSFSQEHTFARDELNGERLREVLHELADHVCERLGKSGYMANTVRLKLRWFNFDTLTRQSTLAFATDQQDTIYPAALALFERVWIKDKAVRLIGVGVSGLQPPIRQLSFWDDVVSFRTPKVPDNSRLESLKTRQLENALEVMRQRYGENIIQRASDLTTKKR